LYFGAVNVYNISSSVHLIQLPIQIFGSLQNKLLCTMIQIKNTKLIIHILGWLFFLSLPLLFIISMPGTNNTFENLITDWQYWYSILFFVAIYYLHSLVLLPKLLFDNKLSIYFAVIIALFVIVFLAKPFEQLISSTSAMHEMMPPMANDMAQQGIKPPPNWPPMQPKRPQVDIISILFFILMIGISIANSMNEKWRNAITKAAIAEAEKANAELSFLKAQINPHFLFNTLNNIYSLAVIKDDNTPDSIMKLSNIMRYVTDDGLENYVPLQREIDCITDYIDLQRLRLGSKVQLSYEVKGRLSDKQIAPLILITFIENVFKYGLSNNQHSIIVISILAEDRAINFYCENNIFATHTHLERSGIGITNTKKRLQFLYPNKHLLTINQENNKFIVQLTLQL
jgi:two-component system LytT family sensor kinase